MEHNEFTEFFRETDPKSIQEFQLDALKSRAEADYSNIKGLFYLIPVPACITNEKREFEEVNDAYCRLYGYERDALVGKSFVMVVPDEAKEELAGRHDDFFHHKHEFSGQWDVVRQNGTARRVLANAAYIPSPGSGHPLKITFVVDVTDVASAQENLRLTNELLSGKLAAQEIAQNLMVHDMRNPITNILSISQMLLERTLAPSDQKWIDLILQLAKRLHYQVQSSADLAKMEAGQYTLKTECFDLLKLIYQVIRAASGDASRKSIELRVTFQGKPLEEREETFSIQADQFYVEQMLTNLLVNALEASPPEEPLDIAVTADTQCQIQITNRGVVPPEIRDNLFEKNVTRGKQDGQGLGTYIAQLIARQHKGTVTFDTRDDENRTTFTITLPKRTG